MRMRPEILLLVIALPLVACKDYGEFTVAEREWVDNDELPALSELDLTGINLEFSIGSEAHARALPEVDWPDPVGALMDRLRRENDGELPAQFDLPLEDNCIYVGLEPRYSRFRRIQFQGRTLLFISYLTSVKSSDKNGENPSIGTRFKPRLAIIDESMDMKRYDLDVESLQLWIVQTESIFGIVTTKNRSIHLRTLHFNNNALVADDPVRLASSGQRADQMSLATLPGGAFHLAWLTERYASLTERFVYYVYIDAAGVAPQPEILLSDTATNRFLHLMVHDTTPIVSWADARFISRGFDTTNQSKIMIGSNGATGNDLWPPVVLNPPKNDSENAFSPVLSAQKNNSIAFLWRQDTVDSRDKSDMQLGLFDIDNRSLSLSERSIPYSEVVSNALQQQIDHQRSMPIDGSSVPDPADCDQWREQLNLKPTGTGIMTPVGAKPITRLEVERKDDNGGDDSHDNGF